MSKSYSVSPPNRALQSAILALGFALLVAVVVGCAWLVRQQSEDTAEVRRVLELQNGYTRVLSILQDAETGQRGFVITQDEAYLTPYRQTAANFGEEMNKIEKLLRLPNVGPNYSASASLPT